MPTHTMRAVRLHEHGGPDVLRYDEVPIPEPGPGEVLVRVYAAGVNPPDWYLRDGLTTMPGESESTVSLPVIPGTDMSGVVEAVAADVDGLAVGDEVFGLLRFPSFTVTPRLALPSVTGDGAPDVSATGDCGATSNTGPFTRTATPVVRKFVDYLDTNRGVVGVWHLP